MGWLNRLLGKEDLTAFKDAEEAINTAMRLSHFGSLKSYLNSNGPTDVLDTLDKSTLLHVAARSGNIENVNLLVQHRADVNAQDSNNETTLHVLINNWLNLNIAVMCIF
jgi:ankyrin repeat protein